MAWRGLAARDEEDMGDWRREEEGDGIVGGEKREYNKRVERGRK